MVKQRRCGSTILHQKMSEAVQEVMCLLSSCFFVTAFVPKLFDLCRLVNMKNNTVFMT